MDKNTAKTLLDYATNDVAYPKTGKNIDFMNSFPGFKDTKAGSGRNRSGENVIGSGPGGAGATARLVSSISARMADGSGDAQSNADNYKNAAAVDAQQRSIQQLQSVRAIYNKAAQALAPKGNNKKKLPITSSPHNGSDI